MLTIVALGITALLPVGSYFTINAINGRINSIREKNSALLNEILDIESDLDKVKTKHEQIVSLKIKEIHQQKPVWYDLFVKDDNVQHTIVHFHHTPYGVQQVVTSTYTQKGGLFSCGGFLDVQRFAGVNVLTPAPNTRFIPSILDTKNTFSVSGHTLMTTVPTREPRYTYEDDRIYYVATQNIRGEMFFLGVPVVGTFVFRKLSNDPNALVESENNIQTRIWGMYKTLVYLTTVLGCGFGIHSLYRNLHTN